MQFSQDIDTTAYVIRSYGPGEVIVSEPISAESILAAAADDVGKAKMIQRRTLTQSVVVTPKYLVADWPPQSLGAVTTDHIQAIAENLAPEIVLLGTGKDLSWPPTSLLTPLIEKGIGVEVMDTPAACRTYNILMFESRRVAAALLMI